VKLRFLLLVLCAACAAPIFAAMTFDNQPVPVLEPKVFEGKWYSLTSIPTPLDRKWRETAESYTSHKGGYDVHTVYRKVGETRWRKISSRLFVPKRGPQGALKAQFWWPFKVDYTIIKIAPDGSWMVGGHPKKKLLFILSRTPSLPAQQMAEIVARCKELGYPVEKLQSQEHRP
jgi:apolipoprotein D and lipocalin family protein